MDLSRMRKKSRFLGGRLEACGNGNRGKRLEGIVG